MALTSLTPPGPEFSPTVPTWRSGSGADTDVVEVYTSSTIDVAAERRRLEKDLAAAQKELTL